jgi:hypothetical protein
VSTQLLESSLAAAVGAATLVAALDVGPRRGGLFLAALGAYTLIRQYCSACEPSDALRVSVA